jgi:hypothetical protein
MSGQFIGAGSLIKMGDGASPEVFTEVANSRDIKFGSDKVDSLKISSDTNVDAFIPGVIDNGDVSFVSDYDPTEVSQTSLVASRGVKKNWKIAEPHGGVHAFTGFVTQATIDLSREKVAQLSVKIKITGSVVYTPAP